jgi:hypothetical protein
MARNGNYWATTFQAGDSFRERRQQQAAQRQPDPPEAQPDDDGERRCARGEWCEERTVVIEKGERRVTAALTPRPFCDGCTGHIRLCLDGPEDGLPRLYGRLAAELGEERHAEVLIRLPFGPSVPLNEAVDAHMRAMTETMASWEERVRDVDSLSDLPRPDLPQDDAADLERSVSVIEPRLPVLLSLQPQEMIRFLHPLSVPEADQDTEILGGDRDLVKVAVKLGGRQAGEEIMHLHYFARRLLLETSPPQPLLPDFRCRACQQKLLRKAAPPWHEDGTWYWSRCDGCGDECTREDYDVNAKRWLAYERAHHERPVLAETPAA